MSPYFTPNNKHVVDLKVSWSVSLIVVTDYAAISVKTLITGYNCCEIIDKKPSKVW